MKLWRSPLDKVALAQAESLRERQPQCSTIGYGEDFSAMTIYNYGHYVPVGVTPDTGLTNMFGAMTAASPIGGKAFIAQKNYGVHATTAGFTVPDQCDIDGSGGGGTPGPTGGTAFFHFVISRSGTGDLKFLNCVDAGGGGGHTSGGKYFRSLAFQWGTTTHQNDVCIHGGTWNTRAVNCTFTDCPRAFEAADLNCALEQCTINYTQGPGTTKAVILAGPQCGVIGPGQFSQTSPFSSGPANCTCISVESAQHSVISDMQLYEWSIGVDFSQAEGTRFTQITNCDIECCQTALNIQLPTSASLVTAGIKVTACALAKASDSNDPSPIVKIDANGNAVTLLNDIALINCAVFNMYASAPSGQHGLQILAARTFA